jgi:hypothetical protein
MAIREPIRLRAIPLSAKHARVLSLTLEMFPTDEREGWRRGQLLELLARLPLPPLHVACPRCGGDGGRSDGPMALHCPGDCCHVCDFCLGRRFFDPSELQSRPHAAEDRREQVVAFCRTGRGDEAVRLSADNQWRRTRPATVSSGLDVVSPTSVQLVDLPATPADLSMISRALRLNARADELAATRRDLVRLFRGGS